jgi:glycosyltransferase involved in cell wall biosynthesis
MKVALIHNAVGGRAGGGGGVRQMLELGTNLERLGHDVVVVCHDYQQTTDFEAFRGLEIRAVNVGEVTPMMGVRSTLERLWRGMGAVAGLVPADVDVVNAHEWPALHAGSLASRRLDVPLVWTRNDETFIEQALGRGPSGASRPRLRTRLLFAVTGMLDLRDARRASEVVVLDRRNAEMVRRVHRRDPQIVGSGPAASFFDPPARGDARARLGIDPESWLIVGVGILMPHRGFEDLIEAVALLGDDPSPVALIVGDDRHDPGYADRLAALIAERGLASRVQLPRESVPDARLRDVYAAADVFVFPNRRQTWGLAPLEALASGVPVVVSSGAGVSDVLSGRPGVRIVPPGDAAGIATALRAMYGDGANGIEHTRRWLREELSNVRYAERMAKLFEAARRPQG